MAKKKASRAKKTAKRKTVKKKAATKKTPWDAPAPKRKRVTTLEPAEKATARKRAKRAGRPYPNLVDNMRAAAERKGGARKKTKSRRG